eukprot:Hpha_TRINITY_DN10559_c0_g1::TRINITY_DN10559_c0_g1_i1::g.31484::m.31484
MSAGNGGRAPARPVLLSHNIFFPGELQRGQRAVIHLYNPTDSPWNYRVKLSREIAGSKDKRGVTRPRLIGSRGSTGVLQQHESKGVVLEVQEEGHPTDHLTEKERRAVIQLTPEGEGLEAVTETVVIVFASPAPGEAHDLTLADGTAKRAIPSFWWERSGSRRSAAAVLASVGDIAPPPNIAPAPHPHPHAGDEEEEPKVDTRDQVKAVNMPRRMSGMDGVNPSVAVMDSGQALHTELLALRTRILRESAERRKLQASREKLGEELRLKSAVLAEATSQRDEAFRRRDETLSELDRSREDARAKEAAITDALLRAEAAEARAAQSPDRSRGEVPSQDNLREQLQNELRGRLRGELRVELEHELRSELRGQFREELRRELREELRGALRKELRGELRDQVCSELREELREEVLRELRDEARVAPAPVSPEQSSPDARQRLATCRALFELCECAEPVVSKLAAGAPGSVEEALEVLQSDQAGPCRIS